MPQHVSRKTLYLTADRSRIVEDGDPDAAFLLVRKGSALNAAEVKRLGFNLSDLDLGTHAEYDARADHAAKHGGETQQDADAKRARMFEGQPDPDGPPAEGERSADTLTVEDQGSPAKARTAALNKAKAPAENK